MKHVLTKAFLVLTLTTSPFLQAHEGHDEAPGQLRSQHGGVVKGGKQLNLEMLAEGSKVTFYPVPHTGEKVASSELKVTATSQLPKGKAAPLKLTDKGDAFTGDVDFGTANRSAVEVKVNYKGKTDTFKFQVEKQ
jgi:hypothetical protein